MSSKLFYESPAYGMVSLNDIQCDNIDQFDYFTKLYNQKAIELKKACGKSVFYCLKHIKQGKGDLYDYANFFLCPIEKGEEQSIARIFSDYFIGIAWNY